jgi:2'-hydroxyisoflavone reductase
VRLLLIGGTSFAGRAIALAGVDGGHEVAVINRGTTPSDLPPGVERLVGDRGSDLSALAGRHFDATIDVIAYRPSNVAVLHGALGDRGGHHVQISSVSAFESGFEAGATELTASTWPKGSVDDDAEITGATYGPLKAAAEREAVACFGPATTIVRPTFIIGGHDVTLRFPYWVQRCRRGGDVAVPGPRSVSLQYVDARDLAVFTMRLVEEGTPGAFTAAGPWPAASFVDVIEQVARQVGPPGTSVVELAPSAAVRTEATGKFPLWSGPSGDAALSMDPSKALAHGLSLRPLADSVDDVVAWWGDRPWPDHWLTADEERTLLAAT